MFKKISPNSNWLVFDNDPIMKQEIKRVEFPLSEEDKNIISKMVSYVDYSYDGEYKKFNIRPGIGIAAIQLGYPKQIIYIHLDDNGKEEKHLLANPKIEKFSLNKAFIQNGEGCLSVKDDVKGNVVRYETIVVKAIDLFTEKEVTLKATGLLSMCLQHEIDHNNNRFYYDNINHSDPFYKDPKWTIIK